MGDRDKRDKKEMTFDGTVDMAGAISQLEDLLAGLKSGTLCVQQGTEFLTVRPAESVDMGVKVRRKGDKESVSVILEWQRTMTVSESTGLKISDKEPPLLKTVEG